VGKDQSPKERNIDWIRALMNSSSGYCDDHRDLRSNEKNTFCVDCAVRFCRHCKEAHSIHRRFQIYRYSYQDVFRHSELQKHFDCSNIQVNLNALLQVIDSFSIWFISIRFIEMNLFHCLYIVLVLICFNLVGDRL
jgi:hypothetical protein